MTFKYFLDRVCLSILSCERKIEKKDEAETLARLWDSQNFETHILMENMKSCKIPRLI